MSLGSTERALLESLRRSYDQITESIAEIEEQQRELLNLRRIRGEIHRRIDLIEQGQMTLEGFIDHRVMPSDTIEEIPTQHP